MIAVSLQDLIKEIKGRFRILIFGELKVTPKNFGDYSGVEVSIKDGFSGKLNKFKNWADKNEKFFYQLVVPIFCTFLGVVLGAIFI